MYKCKHCPYVTTREFDLRRHERRKNPCSPHLTNTNTINAVPAEGQNEGLEGQNEGLEGQNEGLEGQNEGLEGQNENVTCDRCKKVLSCKKSFIRHQKICKNVPSTTCPRCYKTFSSRDVRNRHVRTVKCTTLAPSCLQQASIINNTTNNINIDNSKNVNIHLNFGEEALEKLCNQPDYIKRMKEIVRLGKYALPQHISDIYFNDSFPMNNTIMKTRHNDRFVKIKTGENEWNLRAMDDVYKTLTERMESYMTPYFAHVEKQMERIYDEDRLKFKQMTRSIREFGHKVLWLDWKCDGIRQIGVELNDPYCENERHRRIQEMKTLLLEHVYDKTKEMLDLK